MKNKILLIVSSFLFMTVSSIPAKDKPETTTDDLSISSDASPSPTPQANSSPTRVIKTQNPSKSLVVHKPKPSPSWGKVIQYHRDQILALSEKNREIIHEFVFQDDEGIVRTATFHENAAGEGYWEVWVWDQP